MLLAIDIGNTNISFGLFKGKSLRKKVDIPTKAYNLRRLKNYLKKSRIRDAIICSVVPKVTQIVKRDLEKLCGEKPYCLGKNLKVPIKNLYRHPQQVGQDRLVNAYAGLKFYGSPLIVVDFGTAITFDIISKKGEYLGGLILPGLAVSIDALHQHTALLPKIKLAQPLGLIGRDTKSSILNGIVYGFSALADNLITKIRDRVGKEAMAICTGGNSALIKRYARKIDKVRINLTLEGLNLIYQNF